MHRGDERLERSIGGDAGLFSGLAQQLDNTLAPQRRRHRRAAKDDHIGFLPHQGINTMPIVAERLLHRFQGVVTDAKHGGTFHDIQRHQAVAPPVPQAKA